MSIFWLNRLEQVVHRAQGTPLNTRLFVLNAVRKIIGVCRDRSGFESASPSQIHPYLDIEENHSKILSRHLKASAPEWAFTRF